MSHSLPTPQEVLDKFVERDKNAVDDYNSWVDSSTEAKLNFTSARCLDTASMVVYILRYLAQQETKNGIRQ